MDVFYTLLALCRHERSRNFMLIYEEVIAYEDSIKVSEFFFDNSNEIFMFTK